MPESILRREIFQIDQIGITYGLILRKSVIALKHKIHLASIAKKLERPLNAETIV